MAMVETLSEELEVISLTFLRVLSSCSIFRVIRLSMSSGATPAYTVVTIMKGILTSGAASRGREK